MAPKRKSTSARSTAKRSRTTPITRVVGALAGSAALSENLRNLLKHTLPIVLSANKVDRHAFETEVVDQAQQGLVAVQGALEAAHGAALAEQNAVTAPAEKGKRNAATKDAAAHLEATRARLEANKATKKSAEKDVQEAAHALAAAQKAATAVDKALKRTNAKRSILSSAVENELVLVKGNGSTSPDGKNAVKTLLALGKEYGLDSTLLSTLPITCKKQPEIRTEFESMMLDSLKALMDKEISGLTERVEEAIPGVTAAEATVAAAQGALETAQATEKAASEELTTTQGAHRDATKDVAKADSHQRQIWEDMRAACEAQDSLTSDLKNLKDNIWTAFQALKEKEPVPEPVEEAAPVEEEAPADDAPAAMEESMAPSVMADAD